MGGISGQGPQASAATAREKAERDFARGAQKRIAMAQMAGLTGAPWSYRSRKTKGKGLKGPNHLRGHDTSIAKHQHHHIRERARRLFRPGPERRAFIVAEMARVA